MYRFQLADTEVAAIQPLLSEIVSRYSSVEDADFLRNASIYAHELPRRLRSFLNDFRLLEPAGVCIVSGYPIDDAKIGRTPEHWNARNGRSSAIHEEVFLILCGSLIGDVFGWSTQQAGYILHDVLPIRGHEQEQIGSGSEQTLWWHTEDAFHPYRGDYLGLMCLRNLDNVATTVASIDKLQLEQAHIRTLFEPRFTIRPDESHLQKNRPNTGTQLDDAHSSVSSAYDLIDQMNSNPPKVPVLFGDPKSPYWCLDPYFMDIDKLDEEARTALQALIDAIDSVLTNLVLQPGDCCFIDNYKAVHGRNPFKARYDGLDRWLKRINITRDLRKSRSVRLSQVSRVIR